jgi:hypothetical protein
VTTTSLQITKTFEERRLVKWRIREGHEVSKGQIVADIEDQRKEIMEIEAPESGIIELLCAESASVGPNTAIGFIHPNENAYALTVMVRNVMEADITNIVQRELQPIKEALDKILKHLNI